MLKVDFMAVSHVFEDGTTALKDIDLSLEPGRATALIGPNGAGKTTLVKHINGLLKPSSGTVYLNGIDITGHEPADLASKAGLVFQNPDHQLFLSTAAAEIAFGPKNLGFSKEKIKTAVDEAITLTGLAEHQAENPYNLSPANRKFLALASVLAMDSDMVILDEPTVGLDALGLERLSNILRHIRAKGKSILVISHDMDFCAENLDWIVMMADGRIVNHGPASSVFTKVERLSAAKIVGPQIVRLAARVGLTDVPLDPRQFVEIISKRNKTGKTNEEK